MKRVLVGVTVLLLIGSVAMFFTKSVLVKMLPFDNKNEFQVIIDMPLPWKEHLRLLKKSLNIYQLNHR
jgi:multidrug efflux pump subunit AcrB